MTTPEKHTVVIVCDDSGHAPKVATCGKVSLDFTMICAINVAVDAAVRGEQATTAAPDVCCGNCPPAWVVRKTLDDQVLEVVQKTVDDQVVEMEDLVAKDRFGSRTAPPERGLLDNVRTRRTFACKLCGDRVDLRDESVSRIFPRLAESGIDQISIPGLAAILG